VEDVDRIAKKNEQKKKALDENYPLEKNKMHLIGSAGEA